MTAASCWSPGRPGSASRRWSRPSSRPCVRRSPTPAGCGVGATASSRHAHWAPSSRSPSSWAGRRGRRCAGTRPDRSSSPRSGRVCAPRVRPSWCSRTCTGPTRRRSTCCATWGGGCAACPCSIVATYRDDALRRGRSRPGGPRRPRGTELDPPRRRAAPVARGRGRARRGHRPGARRAAPPHRREPVLRQRGRALRVGGRPSLGPGRGARPGRRAEQLGAERPRRRGARGLAGRAGAAQRRRRRHGGGSRRAGGLRTPRRRRLGTSLPPRHRPPRGRRGRPAAPAHRDAPCGPRRAAAAGQHGRRAAGVPRGERRRRRPGPSPRPPRGGRRGRQGRPPGGGGAVRPGGSLLRRARCARTGRAARHARPGAQLRGRLGGVGAGSTAGPGAVAWTRRPAPRG